MELLDVIERSVIAEKSMLVMDEKKYTFEVDTRAGKTLAKQAVESALDIRVANISIPNVRPKLERMGRYVGYTKERRKVIVTSAEDSKEVQLFEAAE